MKTFFVLSLLMCSGVFLIMIVDYVQGKGLFLIWNIMVSQVHSFVGEDYFMIFIFLLVFFIQLYSFVKLKKTGS
ncbi:hypothetical protein [Metabacillus endolithicus]|uniref:Uncharacterized protein n=2 Tax=Metabacillus endolithicus TaxID=1535204 RepID=A0ABW5BVF0_9BACI